MANVDAEEDGVAAGRAVADPEMYGPLQDDSPSTASDGAGGLSGDRLKRMGRQIYTPKGRMLVLDVLTATFPRVRSLPAHDMRAFSVELVDALGAATLLGDTAGVAQLLAE
ncbi:hypothetical protein [Streptomyces sp. NPDC058385]|uniref:hypothetical protein n=1 Tax=Streptomyces sp. NPDC058385 TaxID=3346473 RepID=UPI003666C760